MVNSCHTGIRLRGLQPTTSDENILLGLQPQSDTIRTIEIVTGKSFLQIFHILAAIPAVLCVLSLIAPAKWFNKGKGGLANFQRSGILPLILGAIAFVLAIVAFVGVMINILAAKNALRGIPGLTNVGWTSTATMWVRRRCTVPFSRVAVKSFAQFILPSALIYIPPFLVILLPTYVRPEEQDEAEGNGQMHPLNNSHVGFGKLNEVDSTPGTPYAGSLNKGQGGGYMTPNSQYGGQQAYGQPQYGQQR